MNSPPTTAPAYLTNFLGSLTHRRAVLQKAAASQQPKPVKLDYPGLVATWWNNQPPATSQHPWSLENIAAAAFVGQPHGPALRLVAKALRQMGFIEKRDWTNAGRNRRTWIPPTV